MLYDTEETPTDWAQMMETPIHQKGDKQTPANYRAVSLLSIPGKETPSATSFQLYGFQHRLQPKLEESTMENFPSHRHGPQDSIKLHNNMECAVVIDG